MACSIDEIRQNYKELFKFSSDYIFIIDLNGKIIDINDSFLQNPEFSSSKILNTNINEFLISQEGIKQSNEIYKSKQFKISTEPLISKINKKDGSPLFIKVDIIPLKKKNSQMMAFLGIGHDITKQIEIESTTNAKLNYKKEIKESEEKFRDIFKKYPYYLAIWQKREEDFILFDYNDVAEKFSRYNLKELKGKSMTKLPEMRINKKIYLENANRCFKEKSTFSEETEFYIDALKRKRKFLVTYSYIAPDLVLCHVQDITRRKKAEQQLKESEEKFRRMFKGTPHFVLAWEKQNDNFILVDFNYNMEDLAKENITRIKGMSASQLYIEEQNRPDLVENLKKCFKEKQNFSVEIRYYVDYLDREMEFLLKYCYIPPNLVLTNIEDITQRKNAAQKLKESEEKFRRLFKGTPHFVLAWEKQNDDFIISDYNNFADTYSNGRMNEYIGKNASQLYLKDIYRPDLIENLRKCFESQSNFTKEFRIYEMLINKERDLLTTYNYIPPNYVLTYIEDITQRKNAEQKLRESEEKYRAIIENAKEGYYEVDLKGNYTLVNNAYCNLLEYTYDEIVGQNYRKFTTKENSEITFNVFNKAFNTGIERSSFEYIIITKNGSIKYGDTSIHLIYDIDGNIIGFRGFLKETTDKKKAEQKLKQSENRFRSLFKGSPNYTLAWQKIKDNFVLIDYNDGAEIFSKGQIRDKIGQTAYQMYNRSDLVDHLNICYEKNSNFTKEIRHFFDFVNKEKDFKIKYTYVPPDLVLSHFEDITERKNAEHKLKESEEKFRLISENSNDLIRIGDSDHRIEYLNENTHLKLLGYSSKDLIGRRLENILNPDEEKKLINFAKRRVENGESSEEIRLRHKDGHWVWFDIFAKEFFDNYGNLKILAISRDITEKKIAELKLKASEKKYRNAYERENFYKDLFAHDMSNILQGMLSSLDLCSIMSMESKKDRDNSDLFETLKEQIQRGANLVKNVRKFSILQESELKLKDIIITDLLEKAINIVKKSSPTKSLNIQVDSIDDNITVQSDEFLLDVFENILFNAVKHNENTNIEIYIRLSKIQEESKENLKIEFMDNGYGVDDSRKLSIFKRGYKEDRSVVGIGLGLSLVYNILNRYNAKIWVENRVPEDYKQGSNFIIQFPLI